MGRDARRRRPAGAGECPAGLGRHDGRPRRARRCSAGRSCRARTRPAGHGWWSSDTACGSVALAPTRRSSVRDILLDGQLYTVVGVMPPAFRFAPFWQTRAELWAPLALTARRDDRDGRSLRVFGRLRAGVSLAQAQQEMTAIASRLEREHPLDEHRHRDHNPATARQGRSRHARHAAGADGDGHLRAADRLRQRRELDAGARLGAAAGNRGPARAWGEPVARGAATADRESAARLGRRVRRPRRSRRGACRG